MTCIKFTVTVFPTYNVWKYVSKLATELSCISDGGSN